MFMCQKSFLYMCDIMQGNNDVSWARWQNCKIQNIKNIK